MKNPDRAIVEKVMAIAQVLGAHVQGDDGELDREAVGEFYEILA
jgi:hypothetical protein